MHPRLVPPIPRLLWLLLVLGPRVRAFFFQWSSTSYQCYTQTLGWVGGSPPFTAVIAPILQMPFVYRIPDSAYVDGKGEYDITVQLTSGLSYIIFMGDATGMGTGGSSGRITVQGYAESACLATANANQTTLDLSFEVFQTNIQQCEKSFNMSWDPTPAATPPYNMTVISLDQSFNPYDVDFGNATTHEWRVNVPAGKGFTVMMNDGAKGYGYGGVGGAYYVNKTGGNAGCEVVGGAATTTTRIQSTSVQPTTSTLTSSTTAPGTGGGPPKSTVIAGASIGALVGIGLSAAVAFFIFVYRRRRRRRRRGASRTRLGQGKDAPAGDSASGIIMADGRRRPASAMSVNLFDESDHDPNDGHYAPVPYEVGASYDGSVTPASAVSLVPGRYDTRVGRGEREGERDPFESEARDRGWTGGAMDSPTGAGRRIPPRTKSDEAIAEAEAVAAAAAAAALTTRTMDPASPALSAPVSSTPTTGGGGGFRITNATDADPLLPASQQQQQPSPSLPPSHGGRRARGEPRFVRHADAGRAREEVIDLPPLYTDLVPLERGEER